MRNWILAGVSLLNRKMMLIEGMRIGYNLARPHSALNYRSIAPEDIVPVIMLMELN